MTQSPGRRISSAAITAPRLVMSWEDWLTFTVAITATLAIAVSIDDARWVRNMPSLVPTALGGMLIGMIGARLKMKAMLVHPFALVLGVAVVALVVQAFADGQTMADRLEDVRVRMREWLGIVRAGDISNDNLPFVTLVHGVGFLSAYMASWSIYRWRNPWLAVIPGGMVLLANISFLKGQPSGTFIVFLFAAVILIARLHLQRSQLRWQRQHVEYPEFMSLSAIQLTTVLTLLLIFGAWSLPLGNQMGAAKSVFSTLVRPATGQSDTLVRLFHNVDSRKGAQLHSFGDFLAIQGHVKLGTRNVYEINSSSPGLVRAQSYEEYTGTGWKVGSRQQTKLEARNLAVTDEGTKYEARTGTILNVKVLDSSSTILTRGMALATNVAATAEGPKSFGGEIEQLRTRRGLEGGDTYNSFGSESTASEEQLLSAGSQYPSWVTDRYLQLPKSLPSRVGQEAKRVTARTGAREPYDLAIAIQDYLRTFPYDLDVESAPPGRDTVDFFLFDLKRGYFDYQATAMAVMLRTLGVPARVAVGYVLDPATAEETRYTVRKDNAYSWVEVFFPNYGWVDFNPTQDRPSGGAGGLGAIGGSASDVFDLSALEGLLDPAFEKPIPDDALEQALAEEPKVHSEPPWVLIWTLVGLLVVAASGALGARLSWNYGMGGIQGRARLWAKVQRAAGWAGLGSRPAETPREWSRRLGGAIDREHDAEYLASAYEEARYGRPDHQRSDDNEIASSYKNLRNRLLAAALRRRRERKP